MAMTPLPVLDRTSVTFKADVDTFFGSQIPNFSIEASALQTEVSANAVGAAASAASALSSKNAAATSEANALESKNAAKTSETNAGTYYSSSLSNKNAAAISATNAAASADAAAASAASIGGGVVTSVNGKSPVSGVVTLVKGDLSLGSVDNTSDLDKPVSKPQLAAMHAIALLF